MAFPEQVHQNNQQRFQDRLGPLALAETKVSQDVDGTLEELLDIFDVYSGVGEEQETRRDAEISAKVSKILSATPMNKIDLITKTATAGLAAGAYVDTRKEASALGQMLEAGLISDEDEVTLRAAFGSFSHIKSNPDLDGSNKMLAIQEVINGTNKDFDTTVGLCLAACAAGAALNFGQFSDQARYPLERAVHANLQKS